MSLVGHGEFQLPGGVSYDRVAIGRLDDTHFGAIRHADSLYAYMLKHDGNGGLSLTDTKSRAYAGSPIGVPRCVGHTGSAIRPKQSLAMFRRVDGSNYSLIATSISSDLQDDDLIFIGNDHYVSGPVLNTAPSFVEEDFYLHWGYQDLGSGPDIGASNVAVFNRPNDASNDVRITYSLHNTTGSGDFSTGLQGVFLASAGLNDGREIIFYRPTGDNTVIKAIVYDDFHGAPDAASEITIVDSTSVVGTTDGMLGAMSLGYGRCVFVFNQGSSRKIVAFYDNGYGNPLTKTYILGLHNGGSGRYIRVVPWTENSVAILSNIGVPGTNFNEILLHEVSIPTSATGEMNTLGVHTLGDIDWATTDQYADLCVLDEDWLVVSYPNSSGQMNFQMFSREIPRATSTIDIAFKSQPDETYDLSLLSGDVGWANFGDVDSIIENYVVTLDEDSFLTVGATDFSSYPEPSRALCVRYYTRSGTEVTWVSSTYHSDMGGDQSWNDSLGGSMGVVAIDSTYAVFGHKQFNDSSGTPFFGVGLALLKRIDNRVTICSVAKGWDTSIGGVNFYGHAMTKWDDTHVVTVGQITDYSGNLGLGLDQNIGIEMYERSGDGLFRVAAQAFPARHGSDSSQDTSSHMLADDLSCCVVDDGGIKTLIVCAPVTHSFSSPTPSLYEVGLYAFMWNGSSWSEVASSHMNLYSESNSNALNREGIGYGTSQLAALSANKFAGFFQVDDSGINDDERSYVAYEGSVSGGSISAAVLGEVFNDGGLNDGPYSPDVKRVPGEDWAIALFENGETEGWGWGIPTIKYGDEVDAETMAGDNAPAPADFGIWYFLCSLDFFSRTLGIASISADLGSRTGRLMLISSPFPDPPGVTPEPTFSYPLSKMRTLLYFDGEFDSVAPLPDAGVKGRVLLDMMNRGVLHVDTAEEWIKVGRGGVYFVTANYAVDSRLGFVDDHIVIDASDSKVYVGLPPTHEAGREIWFKRRDASGNSAVLVGNGSNILGLEKYHMYPYESVKLISDGTDWMVV